jgi:hypothetical protein
MAKVKHLQRQTKIKTLSNFIWNDLFDGHFIGVQKDHSIILPFGNL